MAKTVSGPSGERWSDEVGGFVPTGFTSHKVTRAQKRSEQRLIPWTDGPTTRRGKIARSLWG